MQMLSQSSRYLKPVGGSLLLISCYATWVAWGAGLLALLGFSVAYSFLNPAVPFIDLIREPLFFAALALFTLVSLRQGAAALILALIGGLLLYIGYYVYPNNLPLLMGSVTLLASYLLGRRRNSKLSLRKQKNII